MTLKKTCLSDDSYTCQGNSAFWDAYSASGCPFVKGSGKAQLWLKGWMQARLEEKEWKQITGQPPGCSIPTTEEKTNKR